MLPAAALNGAAYARDALAQLEMVVQQRIVLQCCVFPRTESLTDDAAVHVDYDGTIEGFRAAISKATRHVELGALGTANTISEVLEIMARPEVFEALYLDSTDAVVFQRMGKHVLRMKNTRGTGPSGRSVFLELSDVRIRATMELQALKAQAFDVTVPFAIGIVLAIGLAACSVVMQSLKK